MRVTGVTANLPIVATSTQPAELLAGYLGLSVEELDLGWVARYQSPDGRVRPARDPRRHQPQDSVISVHVGDDVGEAFAEAQRRGYEIVHPLTQEPWGVRRFLVIAIPTERDQHRQPPGR